MTIDQDKHVFQPFFTREITVLFLILSSFLCYGCEKRSQEKIDSSRETITEKNSTAPSLVSPPTLSDQAVAEMLSGATEQFREIFFDENSGSAANLDTPSKKEGNLSHPEGTNELTIDPHLKERYIKDNTPIMVPVLDKTPKDPNDREEKTYRLAYQFHVDEQLQWHVIHRVRKKILYAGKTSGIDTISRTERRWSIGSETDKNRFRCEHTIDSMILYQKEDDKDPIAYDSSTDTSVPREFAIFGTDKTVGKVLERFEIDSLGIMREKEKLVREYHGLETDSKVLVPFPAEEVAVGDSWTIPYTIFLKGRDGTIRSYQATQKFTLEKIQETLAIIRFRTILLSVITDPVIEGQLAEKLFTGHCRFDMSTGRALQTELNFTKSVANAMGETSHLEYHCHLVETLVRETGQNN